MIQPSELSFFEVIVKEGSLSAAARELGVTPASVSKRLTKLDFAVYPERHHSAPKIRAFVEFLTSSFAALANNELRKTIAW